MEHWPDGWDEIESTMIYNEKTVVVNFQSDPWPLLDFNLISESRTRRLFRPKWGVCIRNNSLYNARVLEDVEIPVQH